MSNIFEYKIIDLRLENALFRKCVCKGFITEAMKGNEKQEGLYSCNKCNKLVDKLLYNYNLEMTVVDLFERINVNLSAYDKVAESFIGCPAEVFAKYVREDDTFLSQLELKARGLFITVESFPSDPKFDSKKAKSIKLVDYDDSNLINI